MYYLSILLVCGAIGWYCFAVADKVLCNYRGRDYLGNADRRADWLMFGMVSAIVAGIVTGLATVLPVLWAITLTLLAPAIIICLIAGVYLGCVHGRRLWRNVGVPPLVSGLADRICPPRDPNHFDDEHNPH